MDETTSSAGEHRQRTDHDLIIVGAGWAGMYMLHRARLQGLTVVLLEKGDSVGGTWYWNRYPGARCDVPSLQYSYSFSPELEQEWSWTELFAAQPEIERYANHVADRFGLREAIRFGFDVAAAVFDEASNTWAVESESGERVTSRYVVFATGGYSKPHWPDFPGLATFEGEVLQTQAWPQQPVDFRGKRVAVIGTGASGVQAVEAIGREDVAHLHVFQRTANYAVPAKNAAVDPDYEREYKAAYRAHRRAALESFVGSVYEGPFVEVGKLDDDEFKAHMDFVYARGGTSVYGGLTDLIHDANANQRVAEYLNARVRERVEDPQVAEALCAKGHYLGARRILIENGYFETFNKDNVSLVDLRADPIESFRPGGVVLASGREIELDMVVLATGFDSGTGALRSIDIRGTGGTSLAEKWQDGPVTYLGLMVAGLPNLFSLAGPGSPSIRSQQIVSIEQQVEWVAEFLQALEREKAARVDAGVEAEQAWTAHVAEVVDGTLIARDKNTQYYGANVEGKAAVYVAYIGGTRRYRAVCDAVAAAGYEGFVRTAADGSHLAGDPHWSGPPSDVTETLTGNTVL
jgi:cation diffusion facilitator CzcD-associated flavoprotein CzcO